MAYETTQVPASRSQDAIRQLIAKRSGKEGTRIAIVSDPPREGFTASVLIEGKTYNIRIMATRKPTTSDREREERRIWRVLYYHLKSVFESADSGVMEFRELIMPYILMANGQTVADAILPQLDAKLSGKPERLLGTAQPEEYV